MGHTVMCVCTVYFTAVVGCAFSSPRFTSAENVENLQDGISEENATIQAEIKEKSELNLTAEKDDGTKVVDNGTESNIFVDSGGGENRPVYKNDTATSENVKPNYSEELGFTNETDLTTQKPLLNETMMQEFIRKRHIEGIKDQIMAKLQLPYPPILRGALPKLPIEEIAKVYFETSNDAAYRKHSHYYAKTVRKFITGRDVTSSCYKKKSTGCYHFDIRGRIHASEVQSVQLWIYKLFNHNDPYVNTYVISELEKVKRRKNNLRIKNLVERFETTQKYGWMKIDVTKTVMHWLLKPRSNHGMAVICKDCRRQDYSSIYSTKADTQPFLVVSTRKSHRRGKRNVDNRCTETSTECCLMPFSIKFREVGWDSIVYPPSIEANYCTGSCHARYAANTNHTNLLQNFRWTKATEDQMEQLTPCCSPISYRAQSILYFDGDKIQDVRIPNIAVTDCGCV